MLISTVRKSTFVLEQVCACPQHHLYIIKQSDPEEQTKFPHLTLWIGLSHIQLSVLTCALFCPDLLLGCMVYYTCTDLCIDRYSSFYFPDTVAVLPPPWHRLDSKSVVLYAYICLVSLRGKDKRSVHQEVLEDINNYSSAYIMRIHTWSMRQMRKSTEVFFFFPQVSLSV